MSKGENLSEKGLSSRGIWNVVSLFNRSDVFQLLLQLAIFLCGGGIISPTEKPAVDENSRNRSGTGELLKVVLNGIHVVTLVYLQPLKHIWPQREGADGRLRFVAVGTVGLGEHGDLFALDRLVDELFHRSTHVDLELCEFIQFTEMRRTMTATRN